MSLRFGSLAVSAAAALSAVALYPGHAEACGGCFVGDQETTVVSAHRMALAISPTQTVLWDQIQYAGSPSEFAWVLPVKPGARLELSSDAWFEALDAATSTRVLPAQSSCGFGDGDYGGCGCDDFALGGMSSEADSGGFIVPPPVTVVHQETVGPYATVTLRSEDPEALTRWLWDHGYAIPEDIQPIIDGYTDEGFDFIALRLVPGNGVQQMKPVRVVSPGASPVLPLRMVAGGTGANVAITLFVIGEGRWEAENFGNAQITAADVTWDFKTESSDYASRREEALAKDDGRTWLTSFAKQGALLSEQFSNALMQTVPYTADNGRSVFTIADLYAAQGLTEVDPRERPLFSVCQNMFARHANAESLVEDTCERVPGGGGETGGGAGGSGAGGSGAGAGGSGAGAGDGGGGAGGSGAGAGDGGGGAGGGGEAGGDGGGGASGGGDAEVCGLVTPGNLHAQEFVCGPLDDVGVALTGMHPKDVWVTRLEAFLPREALAEDLQIAPVASQSAVDNWKQAGKATNDPCADSAVAPLLDKLPPRDGGGPASRERTRQMMIAFGAAIALAAVARRALRPVVSAAGARALR
ncbi:DUF2330 domain-containing protein [Sorangium sp. So ce131]|uniref:DUF2330 domain-containing protein n=1 Tax=Sorangium sp. So ce131 TaxID=3133282 RepID=UPI003F5D75AC